MISPPCSASDPATTALVWSVGIIALTSGLAAAVRARPWSPDRGDPSELRSRERAARLALLPVLVLLVLAAFVSFTFVGWSASPPGWGRVRESLPALATCAVTSLGSVACVLTITGRRVRSWWLLVGLLPALGRAAVLLGA